MTIKGIITQVGKSSFVISYKKLNKDCCAVVPYMDCGFNVGDSVVIKGHIYNSRYLSRDFTYKTVTTIDCDKICVK